MRESDPLEKLLTLAATSVHDPGQPPPGDLAERVWQRFHARSNRRRRIAISGAVAGAYIAGLLTMQLAAIATTAPETRPVPDNQTPPSAVASGSNAEPIETDQVDQRPSEVVAPSERVVGSSPSDDDTRISETKTPYALYCELGDAYLTHASGIEAAAECYVLALNRATDDEVQRLSPDDSWLLAALKKERREEG
jgi:hypothetical protein